MNIYHKVYYCTLSFLFPCCGVAKRFGVQHQFTHALFKVLTWYINANVWSLWITLCYLCVEYIAQTLIGIGNMNTLQCASFVSCVLLCDSSGFVLGDCRRQMWNVCTHSTNIHADHKHVLQCHVNDASGTWLQKLCNDVTTTIHS